MSERTLARRIAAVIAACITLSVPQSDAVGSTRPGPTPAENASAPSPTAAQPVPGLQGVVIQRVAISEIQPAKPIPGELAQLNFNVGTSREVDLKAESSREWLAKSLTLVVGGKTLGLSAEQFQISAGGSDPNGPGELAGTIQFRWPGAASTLGGGQTRTQALELRAGSGERDSRIVEIGTGSNSTPWLWIAAAIVLIAGVGFVGWFMLRNRNRAVPQPSDTSSKVAEEAASGRPGLHEPPPESGDGSSALKVVPTSVVSPRAPPEIPDTLVKAIAERQAVLVIGAGISAQAGAPTGSELLLAMIERLGDRAPRGFHAIRDASDPRQALELLTVRLGGFSKAMDAFAASIPRDDLVELIKALVAIPNPNLQLLRGLAAMPWRSVISLTWDDFAKQVFLRPTPPYQNMRVIGVNEAGELPTATRGGDRLLLHPFGELARPSSLALTIDEFRRSVRLAPEFSRAIAGMLQSQTFLFLGLDIDTIEQFVQTVSVELETSGSRHFALVPHDPTNVVREAALSRFGIQMLSYEADAKHSAVPVFTRQLRTAAFNYAAARDIDESAPGSLLSGDWITRVKLEAIGSFEALDLSFVSKERESGEAEAPWSVIFGGNGVGKSTILRAIALVLAGDNPAATAAGRRLLREGAAKGAIEVYMGGQILRTTLVRDRSAVVVTSQQVTPVGTGSSLVLGFPALRGARTADPLGPANRDEIRDPDALDLLPLIGGEVDSRLGDFKQWVVNSQAALQAGTAPGTEAMLNLLDAIIRDLIPGEVESLAPLQKDWVIRVLTAEGPIPFDDLSQGMASIFNWVGVLMQRLFSICATSTRPNLEPAILMIDEIDAHLHPDWQRRLVQLTREHFPNVQIIATSHSPLLAGALHRHELVVLRRGAKRGEVYQTEQFAEPFGQPVQHILTGAVFDMSSDRAPVVEKAIGEYIGIFEKHERTPEETARLAELEGTLERYRYGDAASAADRLPQLDAVSLAALRGQVSGTDSEEVPA